MPPVKPPPPAPAPAPRLGRRGRLRRVARRGRWREESAEPRDITELLRDFDLPPLPPKRSTSSSSRDRGRGRARGSPVAPLRGGRARDRGARRGRRDRRARPEASPRADDGLAVGADQSAGRRRLRRRRGARQHAGAHLARRRLAHRRAARPRRAARDSRHRDGRRRGVAVPRAAGDAVGRQPARAVGSGGRARHAWTASITASRRSASPISRPASTRSCCRPRAGPRCKQRVVIQAGVTSSVLAPVVDGDGRSRVGLALGEGAGRDRRSARTAG